MSNQILMSITSNDPRKLERSVLNLLLSTRLPNRVLLLTHDVRIIDDYMLSVLRSSLERAEVFVDFVAISEEDNRTPDEIVTRFAIQNEYDYVLFVNENVMFDPFCLDAMFTYLIETEGCEKVVPQIQVAANKYMSGKGASHLVYLHTAKIDGRKKFHIAENATAYLAPDLHVLQQTAKATP